MASGLYEFLLEIWLRQPRFAAFFYFSNRNSEPTTTRGLTCTIIFKSFIKKINLEVKLFLSIMPECKLHMKMAKTNADSALSRTEQPCKLPKLNSSMHGAHNWSYMAAMWWFILDLGSTMVLIWLFSMPAPQNTIKLRSASR